jgi:hypothetical protein
MEEPSSARKVLGLSELAMKRSCEKLLLFLGMAPGELAGRELFEGKPNFSASSNFCGEAK